MKVKITMIAALVISIIFIMWGWPLVQKYNLRKRYPVGTLLGNVETKLTVKYQVLPAGIVFPGGGPTEHDKELYSFFDLSIPEENVRLEFNYHKKLIGVRMVNHPFIAAWKRLWR